MNLPRRILGRTGLSVTALGFGALEIGRDWGIGPAEGKSRPDEAEAGAVLNAVLDAGINLVDSARAYHRSEERIGASIAARRGEYVLATKCGEHSDEPRTYYDYSHGAIGKSIDTSLRMLKTDVIDVLEIHFGPEPGKVLDDGETVRAMKDAREAGKVRWLGASIDGDLLARCIDSGDFDVVQVGYSLLNPSQAENIKRAKDADVGVVVRSGLGGGWLTARVHKTAANERPKAVNALLDLCGGDAGRLTKLAVDFLLRDKGVTSILYGTKSVAHLKQAAAWVSAPSDDAMLDRAIELMAKNG